MAASKLADALTAYKSAQAEYHAIPSGYCLDDYPDIKQRLKDTYDDWYKANADYNYRLGNARNAVVEASIAAFQAEMQLTTSTEWQDAWRDATEAFIKIRAEVTPDGVESQQ